VTAEQAQAIYALTSLSTGDDRYVLPPLAREQAVGFEPGATDACAECLKGMAGFGPTRSPKRGG